MIKKKQVEKPVKTKLPSAKEDTRKYPNFLHAAAGANKGLEKMVKPYGGGEGKMAMGKGVGKKHGSTRPGDSKGHGKMTASMPTKVHGAKKKK